jgi:hypothetical protein
MRTGKFKFSKQHLVESGCMKLPHVCAQSFDVNRTQQHNDWQDIKAAMMNVKLLQNVIK